MVFEVSARISTGVAAGLNLRNEGIEGAARDVQAAILRVRSNCTVMLVWPSDDTEVISVTAATVPSARSSGAATVAAMMAGSAPGRLAETRMVGISTFGRLATGNSR